MSRALLACALLAAPAPAQVVLQPLASIDLASTSNAANPEFIGSNPSAIAWDGTDLFVAGFNSAGATANVSITRVANALGAPVLGPNFGLLSTPNLRGFSGLDITSAGIAAAYDTGASSPIGITLWSPGGTQLWAKAGRGGSGVGFDPGFVLGNPALGRGVGWTAFGSGRRALQNSATGADIWTSANGGIINTPQGTFWRDMDFDDASGNIYLREGNNVIRGIRTGDNSFSPMTVIFDPVDADGINGQNLAYVCADGTSFVIFNDRGVATSGQSFTNVVKAILPNGTPIALDFGTFALPTGNGYYDFSWHAPSRTLALLDFANRFAHVFRVASATAPATRHEGLAHRPLCDATLSINPAGNLLVSNLGSSGQDGVAVELGQVSAWTRLFPNAFDPATLPNGAYVENKMYGTVNGVADHLVLTGRMQAVNGRVQVSLDFSPIGATTHMVEVFNDGVLVARVTGHTGPAYEVDSIDAGLISGYFDRDNPKCADYCSAWNPKLITIPGGPSVLGNRVEVTQENKTATVGRYSRGETRVFGMSSLEIDEEEIGCFDLLHSATGGLTLESQESALSGRRVRALGIGSSGQDGVEVQLPKARSFSATFEPISSAAPLGAFVRAESRGKKNGLLDQPLGSFTVTRGATGFDCDVDFSPLASPTYRVQVLLSHVLVADLPGLSGPVGSMGDWPQKIGKLGGTTECFVACHPTTTTYSILGVPYVGDELRVLAESTSSIAYKSSFTLKMKDLPELVIVDEQAELEFSAEASVLGSACPSPAFSHFATLPVIGGLETLSVAGATPSAPVFLIAGLPLPVGFPLFPPCELYVDPLAFSSPLVLLADGSGSASIGLPIPDDLAFVGGVIATQAFDILSFAPLSLAHSNAMRLRFGF